MLSWILSPRINVDPLFLREPKKFFPSGVKAIYLFPESLENAFGTVDDFIIRHIQMLLNPLTMVIARLVSDFYAVEVVAFIPYLLLFIGFDKEVLSVLCQSITLLILSQLPKRFMWRYRPYMVGRAKIGSGDKTSSFPARTVGCGIVMTYIGTIVFSNHYNPEGAFNIAMYYATVTMAFILVVIVTSFCRIVLGAHYPSDCFIGTLQGMLSCFLGNGLYLFLSCSKELVLADKVSNVNWDNISWNYVGVSSLFAVVFVLLMNIRPLQLWTKSPLVAGLLLPSVMFSRYLCPTKLDDSVAVVLAEGSLFFHHFIVLGFALSLVVISYKYFKPRLLSHRIGYFSAVYGSLLIMLMLQRLDSTTVPIDLEGRG